MVNVDFSRASLRYVGFRNLTLDRVRLPSDKNHVVIRNFAAELDRMIGELQQQKGRAAEMLIAFLSIDRKWIPESQVQGVINLLDLAETAGSDGVKLFMSVAPRESIVGRE